MDAARSAIYISDVRIERFVLDGVDEGRRRQLAKAANVIMDQFVREMPLHRFHLDDLRLAGVQLVPTRGSPRRRPASSSRWTWRNKRLAGKRVRWQPRPVLFAMIL